MNIDLNFFTHKTVLVFGFGSNGGGLGTVQFLLTTKAKRIIIADKKGKEELQATSSLVPSDERVEWRLGEERERDFLEADIVIKNPSIKWDHPLLQRAKENGATVLMDSTIFMALCKAPILGVTGSKGKTTTATLLAHILETAGYQVVTAGVSQTGVLSQLSLIQEDSVVVFELSSWRLSGLSSIQKSPVISVITNLYPDHLNYYGTMENYAEDKRLITKFQTAKDTLVVPHSNHWTKYFTEGTEAQIQKFGSTEAQDAWQDERALYLRTEEGAVEIFQKEKSTWQGEYIFANFLAASLAAKSFGVSIQNIIEALKTFSGVPHRFQVVGIKNGIRYINDTTATIPAAALSSLASIPGPVVLLAGGSDKGLPLEDLVTAIIKSKFTVLFSGSGTDLLLPILQEQHLDHYQVVASMKEAITVARAKAEAGESILLAPGAASFGMFQNEFDRGKQFIKEVESLD